MNYKVIWTSQFKKDYKQAIKRHFNMELIDGVIRSLSRGEQLPRERHDHELSGSLKGFRECHIQPDWLLVYKVKGDILVLTLNRTGTHSDLFGK